MDTVQSGSLSASSALTQQGARPTPQAGPTKQQQAVHVAGAAMQQRRSSPAMVAATAAAPLAALQREPGDEPPLSSDSDAPPRSPTMGSEERPANEADMQRLTTALTAVLSTGMQSDYVEGLKPVLHDSNLVISTYIRLGGGPGSAAEEPLFIGMFPSLPAAVAAQKQAQELVGSLPPHVARRLITQQLAVTDPAAVPAAAAPSGGQLSGCDRPPERLQSNTTSDNTAVVSSHPQGCAPSPAGGRGARGEEPAGEATPEAPAAAAAGVKQEGTAAPAAATQIAAAAAADAPAGARPVAVAEALLGRTASGQPLSSLTDDMIRLLLHKGLHALTVAQQQQQQAAASAAHHVGEQGSSWQQQQQQLDHGAQHDLLLAGLLGDDCDDCDNDAGLEPAALLSLQQHLDGEAGYLGFGTPGGGGGSSSLLRQACAGAASAAAGGGGGGGGGGGVGELGGSTNSLPPLLPLMRGSSIGGPPSPLAALLGSSQRLATASPAPGELPLWAPLSLAQQGPGGLFHLPTSSSGAALSGALLATTPPPHHHAHHHLGALGSSSYGNEAYAAYGLGVHALQQAHHQQQQQHQQQQHQQHSPADSAQYHHHHHAATASGGSGGPTSSGSAGGQQQQQPAAAAAATARGAAAKRRRGAGSGGSAAAAAAAASGGGGGAPASGGDPRLSCVKSVQYRVSRFPSELHDLCIEHWESARCARVVCNNVQGVLSVQGGRCVVSYHQGPSEVVKGIADYLRHAGEERIKKWRRHVRMVDFPRPNNRSGELMTAEEFLCIVGFQSEQGGGKRARHADD